jgi:hypothetical protein
LKRGTTAPLARILEFGEFLGERLKNILSAISLLLLTANSFAQSIASIQGSVVDAVTGLPIADVHITLARGSDPLPPPPQAPALNQNNGIQGVTTWFDASGNVIPPPQPISRPTYNGSTDVGGKFLFDNLNLWDYRLKADADGYLTQEYVLSAGENAPVNFRLTSAAIVSGSVTDPEMQPLESLPVYLLRATFTVDGQRRFRAEKETTTDKAGHYKFDTIAAGRYLIAAGRFPTIAPAQKALTPYAFVYYPGVSEAAVASSIDLSAGMRREIDTLVAHPMELRQVRGRVVDTRTGRPPAAATVTLLQTFPFDRAGRFSTETRGGRYDRVDGTFSFDGLTDGSYRIGVILPDLPNSRGSILSMFTQASDAYLNLDLAGSDREDLVVRLP